MFAAFLLTKRFRGAPSIWFLVLALLVMASVKVDQLYQMLGGLVHAPAYGFMLTPLQWLMTPALYFFVRAKITPDFKLSKSDGLHLIPFLLSVIYLTSVYYRLPLAEKQALLASGWLAMPFNRFVEPVLGHLVQLVYLVAAIRLLGRYGVSLRNWFSSVEAREFRWLRRLLILWAGIFILHLGWVVLRMTDLRIPEMIYVMDLINLMHLAFINVLTLSAITDHFQAPAAFRPRGVSSGRYAGSTQSEVERRQLFNRLEQLMMQQQMFLQNNLTLGGLADALPATPREISEAINAEGGINFFEFVNQYRIEQAKQQLAEQPDSKILEVAYAVGFNSKSAFNEAFKKHAGLTPSAYKKQHKKS